MSYEKYYTGSDVFVYLVANDDSEIIYLDKLAGISINEQISAKPIYGLGDSEFGFVSQGNTVLYINLDVNFIHDMYIPNAIARVSNHKIRKAKPDPSNAGLLVQDDGLSFYNISSMSISQLTELRDRKSARSATSKLHSMPRNFKLTIAFNNATPMQQDNMASTIYIKDCVPLARGIESFIDADGQLIHRFSLIGKYV